MSLKFTEELCVIAMKNAATKRTELSIIKKRNMYQNVTPKPRFQTLPLVLALVKAGNTSEDARN